MTIRISGVEQTFSNSLNVAALLEAINVDGRGVAVAVNDTVVRKSAWQEQELRDGDRVEIVRAVQGG